jgi:UDP-N-acetylglucosamine:LPS N-acetylglucosamine transferase
VFQVLRVLVRERPELVISTGAAPGCLAIALGRLLGARTIWLDSIANVERLSVSGRLVRPFCDLWLTQWPHLAARGGPAFAGRVL